MSLTLYGAEYSVFVRIARLVLEEKGVAYDLVPVDIFAEGGPSADHLRRHPLGKIPVLEHDGFSLYETGAITRYVDEDFEGPALQPAGTRERARMNQVMAICDSYVYRPLVWDVFVERIEKPKRDEVPDEAKITAALAKGRTALLAITDLMGARPFLAGESMTLADLYLAPMMDYLLMTGDGRQVIEDFPALKDWWARLRVRPSMSATAYP